MAVQVERVQQEGQSAEKWRRTGPHHHMLGVSASQSGMDWHIWVNAAESVREEPLESQLREAVATAIAAVDGVDGVEEEDREVWLVWGNVSGAHLVEAVADALDRLESLLVS